MQSSYFFSRSFSAHFHKKYLWNGCWLRGRLSKSRSISCCVLPLKERLKKHECYTRTVASNLNPEAYSEPSRTSKIEHFLQPLTSFAKAPPLDIRLDSEYASGIYWKQKAIMKEQKQKQPNHWKVKTSNNTK